MHLASGIHKVRHCCVTRRTLNGIQPERVLTHTRRQTMNSSDVVSPLGLTDITVVLGDPNLPDRAKRTGAFEAEVFEAFARLKAALAQQQGYRFTYLEDHTRLLSTLVSARPGLVLNFCDTGFAQSRAARTARTGVAGAAGHRIQRRGPDLPGIVLRQGTGAWASTIVGRACAVRNSP